MLAWETAQFSQLSFAVSLQGQAWNFPLSHLLLSSPFLLAEQMQSGMDAMPL